MSAISTLSALLDLENSVIYGVDAAGGVLAASGASAELLTLAEQADESHRLRRDALTADLLARRATAPAALPAYAIPVPLGSVATALALLVELESRCTTAYRQAMLSLTGSKLRGFAVDALTDSAVRATRLQLLAGRSPATASTAFPGTG
ncbi:MAG: DUF4439 domain-containing protein [Mycobacteriales bacterium]